MVRELSGSQTSQLSFHTATPSPRVLNKPKSLSYYSDSARHQGRYKVRPAAALLLLLLLLLLALLHLCLRMSLAMLLPLLLIPLCPAQL